MVDSLINDGDIVLMQYVNVVENGEMVAVWLRAEEEVTRKRAYAYSRADRNLLVRPRAITAHQPQG